MAYDILIVDDEADIRGLIADILKDEGFFTRTAGSSHAALEEVRHRLPSLIILDVWLGANQLDGLKILEIIKQETPNVPVLMMSGHGNIDMAVSAIQKGAYDFIQKPFDTDRLLITVKRALESAQLQRQFNELQAKVSTELLGHSQAFNQLKQSLAKVSPTGSRIFIQGGLGAGKETVARYIHQHSKRAYQPFVVMNCALMHPDRFEIELFGRDSTHNSSTNREVGLLERAHGGTLYLDEVTDMPLETQGKFVRVLQDNGFIRVGGLKKVDVDVRIIAASHLDAQSAIHQGLFREDLYYRLSVVPLKVPSLNERREDIPMLAQYFLDKAATQAGLPLRQLTAEAAVALQSYAWPANIRQLKNSMEWIVIMYPQDDQKVINISMLPNEVSHHSQVTLTSNRGAEIMAMPLREAREVFEKDYLIAQVNRFSGNISLTANFIGMERSALHRKLKTLGVTNLRAPSLDSNEAP